MPVRGNITVWECARGLLCALFTVSINIECRRARLHCAGSYQRWCKHILCVFPFCCGGDKEMGDGPAVAQTLSQVTGIVPQRQRPPNLLQT